MTKGKKKCEILKAIRCQVAKKNGIEYTYAECTHQGECRGTCPKCEEELRYLTRELEKIKQSGKQVAVAGVAAAVIATSAAGCSSDLLTDLKLPFGEEELAGAMVAPEELDGDVAYTPDPKANVTMGEPAYIPPTIGDVVSSLQRGEEHVIYDVPLDVRTEWAEWLVVNSEVFDIYEFEGTQIRIIYNRRGGVAVIELWEADEVTPSISGQEAPSLQDVIRELTLGEKIHMDFERTELQEAWARWLAGCGEDYDIFTFVFTQVLVIYDDTGWTDSVTLFATSLADMKQTAEWKLLDETARKLKDGEIPSLEGYQSSDLRSMWRNYRVKYGDDYDVFRCGEIEFIDFIVSYDEAGMVHSVALYAGATGEEEQ